MAMEGNDSSKPLVWQDLVPIVPLTLLCAPKFLAILALAVVALFVLLPRPKHQRLLKDVPVAGLEEEGVDIKDLRVKFRHGSKNILLEGYRKVGISDLKL